MAGRYWLVKSEADVYSIDNLKMDGVTPWDGVRNYEARNIMRDGMKDGDLVLYYHSNASPPGVAGVARVEGEPYPDPTQFQPKSPYHDPKSDPDDPRWILVDLAFVEKLPGLVSLQEIRETEGLQEMTLLKRMRLSVQDVREEEFHLILERGRSDG
ncbi:MAG: EVE domain-containing protein [Gemmatimonadota bacterium]